MVDFKRNLLARKAAMARQDNPKSRIAKQSKATPSPTTSPVKIPLFVHDFSRIPAHSVAPRDMTFVAVNSPEDLKKLLATANQRANAELLAMSAQSVGTISDADEFSITMKEVEKSKKACCDQFGEYWGLFFFWMRGGGQEGKGSPIWEIIKAARPYNTRMGTAYPPPRYPNAPRISPVKLPAVPLTERDK
jgi:hypothetical protein